ncbi:MAG: hypothetical protein KKC14_19245 [Alphaproteobacteria bacterium]|nr:hypothetical protein [Alphaproteobacteria bacterium]
MIEVEDGWLADVEGEPNHDGIYLGALLPALQGLDRETGQPIAAMTATQISLGLAGLAHLEILNGGLEQLSENGGRLAAQVPAAFLALGWADEAEALEKGLGLLKPGISIFGQRATKLEKVEADLVEFLESRRFYEAIVSAVKLDPLGFTIVSGSGSTAPTQGAFW